MALDLLVLVLQVVMMALVLKRRGMELKPVGDDGHSSSSSSSTAPRTQTYDAEERGISTSSEEGDMSDESSSSSSTSRRDCRDPLSPSLHHEDPDHHPLDVFHSGQYVVANLHLITILRKELIRYRNPPSSII